MHKVSLFLWVLDIFMSVCNNALDSKLKPVVHNEINESEKVTEEW